MKWIIGSVYLVILAGLIWLLWKNKIIRNTIKDNYKSILLFGVITLVVTNCVLYFHLRSEDFIPYWDFGGFYRNALEFIDKMDRSISEAMINVWDSINHNEYNLLAEWFLYTPMKLLGTSFLKYVLCVYNCFLFPAQIVIYIFFLHLTKNRNKILLLCTGVFIATFSANIYSLVQGYIGSAGLVIVSSLLLLVYVGIYEEKNYLTSCVIGLYLLLLLLIRRWYAYFIVTFFLCIVVAYIAKYNKKLTFKSSKIFITNVFISGIIPLLILIIGLNPLFTTITTYNYAESYSVMQLGGPDLIASEFIRWYGCIPVMLLFIGVIGGIIKKEYRFISVFCALQVILSIFLFTRVQILGSHHYYIVNCSAIVLMFIGIIWLYERINEKVMQVILLGISIIVLLNTSKTLVFTKGQLDGVFGVSEKLIAEPLPVLRIDEDKETIQNLAYTLDEVPGEYEYVYVLSNSASFNDDLLRNAFLPERLDGVKNLLSSSSYDTRDGIPYSFFQFYYIVVADPIQLQFEESKQRCVSVLADFFLHDERVKDYYQITQTITLEDGVKLNVYKRINTVPNDIRQEISETLREYYPDLPSMYELEMMK